MEPTIDVQPEKIRAQDRSVVQVVTTSAHRLITSPQHEVICMIDSPKPTDHEWSPPTGALAEILHSLPDHVTRLSIRFERI